jgi:succinate dehydrogenase / fumarate reductase cytochrome b subunit
MLILSFQHPLVTGFYLLSVFLVCLHMSHGMSSMVQTLGLNSKKTMPLISRGGRILAWLIFAGYASIPLAVYFGVLKLHHPV